MNLAPPTFGPTSPATCPPIDLSVTSRSPSKRRAACGIGLAGDDVTREIDLDATFDKVLQQALLSVGIVNIGLVAEGTAEFESCLQNLTPTRNAFR